MANSMTGFGRGNSTCENTEITAEIRSVNHRYFEFSVRMPRSCSFLEDKLKKLCNERISRGKVELYINLETKGGSGELIINTDYADAYMDALKALSKKYKLKNDAKVSLLASSPEIFTYKKTELDEEKLEAAVTEAVNGAIDVFLNMRKIEGERLCRDLVGKIEGIKEKVAFIEERSPETVKLYRQRLEEKIKEILSSTDIDEQRIITETAIFADKVAVDEETVRLRSHMQQFTDMLSLTEPVGRKLDFIVQEMNRETNTIGSKAQDSEILSKVVDIKSEIEKIREQIQNIE
ncbi:MAG: YicC family protein [Clostridiales bacterium]|nr:YicC family protein [Candidatus Equinaster intestinalis]